MIPQAAPRQRIARFREAIAEAINGVVDSDTYILGEPVEAFEAQFAGSAGCRHAIGVSSGTEALTLALRALGVGLGDEVVLPSLTFAGSAQAVLQCGALPRFADVDPQTRCLDPAAAAAAIGPRTVAVMPVHLFGHPADMPAFMALAERYGLVVVEDCAQAHGASLGGRALGSFGHAAAFSFYPTKNLGCIGDGGAVTTNDARIAARVRSLRNYGFAPEERISRELGFNARLDTLQATILSVLLPHCDAGNAERRELARGYRERLAGQVGLGLPPDAEGAVYHQFTVTHRDRDGLRQHLAASGIGTAIHYAPGLHRHPAFLEGAITPLPATDALSDSLLSLPAQPEIALPHLDVIAQAVREFCEAV